MSRTEHLAENVTLHCGDCLAIAPSLAADVIITDPPYGVGIKYGTHYNDSRSDYWEWIVQVTAQLRSVVPHLLMTHRTAALRYFTDHDWVAVWHKPGSFGARVGNSYVLPHWEPILMWGIHGRGVHSKYLPDVLSINPEPAKAGIKGIGREKWDADGFASHPTPKPLSLMRRLIDAATEHGQTVMDPFMGSGTTGVAAVELGRGFVGIEIEPRHFDLSCRRIEDALSRPRMFKEPQQKQAAELFA